MLLVCCLHITATDSSAVGTAERERERAMEARVWDEAATAGTEGDKWPERKEAACLMHNPHETVLTKLQIPSSLPVPFWKVLIV